MSLIYIRNSGTRACWAPGKVPDPWHHACTYFSSLISLHIPSNLLWSSHLKSTIISLTHHLLLYFHFKKISPFLSLVSFSRISSNGTSSWKPSVTLQDSEWVPAASASLLPPVGTVMNAITCLEAVGSRSPGLPLPHLQCSAQAGPRYGTQGRWVQLTAAAHLCGWADRVGCPGHSVSWATMASSPVSLLVFVTVLLVDTLASTALSLSCKRKMLDNLTYM